MQDPNAIAELTPKLGACIQSHLVDDFNHTFSAKHLLHSRSEV